MAKIAGEMVESAMLAFLNVDEELAETVARRDQELDQLHSRLYHDLASIILGGSPSAEQALSLLWIARSLERIGDYATNICERAIYVATGELREIN